MPWSDKTHKAAIFYNWSCHNLWLKEGKHHKTKGKQNWLNFERWEDQSQMSILRH